MNACEFHANRMFAETPFGRIAYVQKGSGPAALFVHALPLCGYQWRFALDELSQYRTCVALDLLGLGYTQVAGGRDVSFESQAKMLAAFLDARKIQQVDLAGNDTGGGVSQIFASLYPERVRTLTLTNCEVHDLWPNAMLEQFVSALKSGAVGAGLSIMARNESVAHEQLKAALERPEILDAESLDAYFGPFAESAERRELIRGFADFERNRDVLVSLAPELRASKIPAQVIWGEADTTFNGPASIEWLRSNLGGLRKVTTIPAAKLFWPEEHPRLLTVLLKEFWSTQN